MTIDPRKRFAVVGSPTMAPGGSPGWRCRTPSAADRSFDPRDWVTVARPSGRTLELFDTPRATPPYKNGQHLPTFSSHVPSYPLAVVVRQRSKS